MEFIYQNKPDQGCEIDANGYAKCRRFDDSLTSHMYESVGSRFLQQKLAAFLERSEGNLDSGGDTCSGYKSVNSYESIGTLCGMLPKLMAQASANNTLICEELTENESEYQSPAEADVNDTSSEDNETIYEHPETRPVASLKTARGHRPQARGHKIYTPKKLLPNLHPSP